MSRCETIDELTSDASSKPLLLMSFKISSNEGRLEGSGDKQRVIKSMQNWETEGDGDDGTLICFPFVLSFRLYLGIVPKYMKYKTMPNE